MARVSIRWTMLICGWLAFQAGCGSQAESKKAPKARPSPRAVTTNHNWSQPIVTPPRQDWSEASIDDLMRGLRSEDWQEQRAVLDELGSRTPGPEATQVAAELIKLASMPPTSPAFTGADLQRNTVLSVAANALEKWATPESMPELVKLLNDSTALATPGILRAIVRLKPPEAMAPLAEILTKTKSVPLRWQISELFKEYGPSAEDAVIPVLESENEVASEAACRILESIGTSKSLDPLRLCRLNYKDSKLMYVADEAIAAVSKRDPEAAKIPLQKRFVKKKPAAPVKPFEQTDPRIVTMIAQRKGDFDSPGKSGTISSFGILETFEQHPPDVLAAVAAGNEVWALINVEHQDPKDRDAFGIKYVVYSEGQLALVVDKVYGPTNSRMVRLLFEDPKNPLGNLSAATFWLRTDGDAHPKVREMMPAWTGGKKDDLIELHLDIWKQPRAGQASSNGIERMSTHDIAIDAAANKWLRIDHYETTYTGEALESKRRFVAGKFDDGVGFDATTGKQITDEYFEGVAQRLTAESVKPKP